MSAMKEAKKSALHALIKSMNKKRMAAKKVAPAGEVVADEHESGDDDVSTDHDQELDSVVAGGSFKEDGDEHDDLDSDIKGFMKRGRDRPMQKHAAPSLTVVLGTIPHKTGAPVGKKKG